MKKRYLVLTGIAVACLAAAGCGKKESAVQNTPEVQVSAAPKEEGNSKEGELINMQQSANKDANSDIKNIIGEKGASASQIVIVNSTGAEIAELYVRRNTEDDGDWGSDLINGSFALADKDKALYYFTAMNGASAYDIRIVYTDGSRSECYFRKIPLQNINRITLCMDESDDGRIPYARYILSSTKSEVSTLTEVKKRLGLLDDSSQSAPTPTPKPAVSQQPTPTPGAGESPVDPNQGYEDDPQAAQAKNYIGKTLNELISEFGDPDDSTYETQPENGETGYHFYKSFTVSTTTDENGNEIVNGIW